VPEHSYAEGSGSPEAARRATPGDTGAEGRPRSGDEISVLGLVIVLLRHRRLVVIVPIVAALLAVLVALVLPRSYRSTASLTPQSEEAQLSQLAGLASQFGISVPTGGTAESPQFYADLLRTRSLLTETAVTEYRFDPGGGGEGVTGDLVEILGIEADTRPVAIEEAVEDLREDVVRISTDLETGIVELSVTTRWPDLSRQIAERMLELVNRFNVETRNSRAAAEREFTRGQLAEAEAALREAEDGLAAFLQQNRRYDNSPELRFQFDRLQRGVDFRQQVFTSLAQSYEQARIDAVRDVPVVTIVEAPDRPAQPEPRGVMWKGMLGLFLGAVVGVALAFGREMLATSRRTDPDDYAEFARLRREAAEDLRLLWYRLPLPFGSGARRRASRETPGGRGSTRSDAGPNVPRG